MECVVELLILDFCLLGLNQKLLLWEGNKLQESSHKSLKREPLNKAKNGMMKKKKKLKMK
jgi:hypothetical protein